MRGSWCRSGPLYRCTKAVGLPIPRDRSRLVPPVHHRCWNHRQVFLLDLVDDVHRHRLVLWRVVENVDTVFDSQPVGFYRGGVCRHQLAFIVDIAYDLLDEFFGQHTRGDGWQVEQHFYHDGTFRYLCVDGAAHVVFGLYVGRFLSDGVDEHLAWLGLYRQIDAAHGGYRFARLVKRVDEFRLVAHLVYKGCNARFHSQGAVVAAVDVDVRVEIARHKGLVLAVYDVGI